MINGVRDDNSTASAADERRRLTSPLRELSERATGFARSRRIGIQYSSGADAFNRKGTLPVY